MHRNDVLSIGQLAERTGLAVSAIRFYEKRGLIAPSRSAGGQRRFRRSDIRRLSFIRIAQLFGFTLPRIATLLSALPGDRTPTRSDWTAISLKFRAELDARIDSLTRLRDNLDGCIGCGCLSLDKCALYNPGDQARDHGSGPRYLMGDHPPSPD